VAFKFYTFGLCLNYNHWVRVCSFIPSILDSIIIIGSGFYYFIPSVRVSFINVRSGFSIKNLNFSFLGQIFQYCLLGLKACRLRFASLYQVYYHWVQGTSRLNVQTSG